MRPLAMLVTGQVGSAQEPPKMSVLPKVAGQLTLGAGGVVGQLGPPGVDGRTHGPGAGELTPQLLPVPTVPSGGHPMIDFRAWVTRG